MFMLDRQTFGTQCILHRTGTHLGQLVKVPAALHTGGLVRTCAPAVCSPRFRAAYLDHFQVLKYAPLHYSPLSVVAILGLDKFTGAHDQVGLVFELMLPAGCACLCAEVAHIEWHRLPIVLANREMLVLTTAKTPCNALGDN